MINEGRYEVLIDRLQNLVRLLWQWVVPNLNAFTTNKQPIVWVLGIVVGVGAAVLAVAFRELIGLVQYLWSGEHSEIYLSAVREAPWYAILLAPALGGVVVGGLLHFVSKTKRAGGVADVIEARHIGGRVLGFKDAVLSALITIISLGSGNSAGREGPAIHLGASFSSVIFNRFSLPDSATRTLLAAGAASAVSASFNAPIAGVLFAHEVILGHYSMRAFVPIVLSSVAGTVVARNWFGESLTFNIPVYEITSYLEFPAFFALGVVCALVAILFQLSLFSLDYLAKSVNLPLWVRPPIGGLVVGFIGVFYPEILGIGYETTNDAIWGRIPIMLMVILILLKIFATAVTYASRFGGGVFSPALLLGALTGGVFGVIATGVFPELASDQNVYSILGMGAIAATVIGAPISTTVIVFELTGGYALSIALLFTIAVSHGINQAIHGRSFFQWQLEMRGLHVRDGPYKAILAHLTVQDFMVKVDLEDDEITLSELKMIGDYPTLSKFTSMDLALQLFDTSGHSKLPVIEGQHPDVIIAWAEYSNAINLINNRLIETQHEEHN